MAVIRRMVRDLNLDARDPRRCRPCATPTGSRSRRATPVSPPRSARGALPSLARSRPATSTRHAPRLAGLDVDYVEVADFDPPVLAAAIRVGSTRLIDNVVLTEEKR